MKQADLQTYLLKNAAEKLIPLHCLFELTYRCNLNCLYCYITKNKKKELEKAKVFGILRQLKEAGCFYLTFSGGEPLIRKDFFEIADYARKLKFALRIFTNATLVNESIADKLGNLKPISVEISLCGFKDMHEEMTQVKGSFDKTVKAIRLLRERNVEVLVKMTLTKQNVSQVWKLKRFVKKELGVKWRGIGGNFLVSPCDDGNKRPLQYRLNDEQLKKYIKEEKEEFRSVGKEYKPKKVKKNDILCGAGRSGCNITPSGELNPCAQIRLKNNCLNGHNLSDVWQYHPELNYIRSLRVNDLSECRKCELLSYCFYCPGIARLEQGSFLSKLPEACRLAKIRKEIYSEVNDGQKE